MGNFTESTTIIDSGGYHLSHIKESLLYMKASLALIPCLWLIYKFTWKKTRPLPPGPIPIPIIGNIQELIQKEPLECFKDWHQKYGPIITLRYGTRLIMSVSSYEIAHDLFEHRGAIYSSRPRFIIASEHMSGSMNLALLPNNRRWQEHRRVIGRFLDPNTTKRYAPIQDLEGKQVLFELLSSNDFEKSIARYSASLMLTMAYGIHVSQTDSPVPGELWRLNQLPFKAIGDMYCVVVELFPFLDHAPRWMAPWKSFAMDASCQITELFMNNLETAKRSKSWNWIKDAMQSELGKNMPDAEIAGMIGAIQQTGVEALSIVTRLTIKALVLNPDCIRRGQEELDRVVGLERIPSATDLPKLPYVNAIVNEAMRWQPPSPIALPHVNTKDEEYMGYRIPKGTSIIPNLWVMGTNFPDPEKFQPERWIENPDLPFVPFGFGRRLCPGRHVAHSSIAVIIAQLLWAYNISHVYRDGKKVEIDAWNLILTAVVDSRSFEASFQVRSHKHKEVIEKEWIDGMRNREKILQDLRPSRDD